MNVWLGLWLGAALLEGAVLSMSYIWLYKAKVFRWVMVVLALFGSVGSTLLLVQHDWRVWLLPRFYKPVQMG
jgi:hypothetical protein